eukprot:TRINITY_DN16478_c0_g1_i1.p1 TRINITY_DN16478_c0_g1~~TRINITY_DN16478_c0_g1_i1.p1  ORF type:complete len:250 (-),score=48.46 TRINITY_DN16478_c0_g1_i1:215-964(-)
MEPGLLVPHQQYVASIATHQSAPCCRPPASTIIAYGKQGASHSRSIPLALASVAVFTGLLQSKRSHPLKRSRRCLKETTICRAEGDGEGLKPQPKPEKEDLGGEIKDVQYVFVNTYEEEDQAMTAQVLNRVNMISKAHQGVYKAPEGIQDTERGTSALTGALSKFPTEHEFKAVGKTGSADEQQRFVRLVVEAIEKHTEKILAEDALTIQERMGGRYTSVSVRQKVANAQTINAVLSEIGSIPEVMMHF